MVISSQEEQETWSNRRYKSRLNWAISWGTDWACKALVRDLAVGYVREKQKMSGSHVRGEISGEDALWGNGLSGKGSLGSCKQGNFPMLTTFWEPGFQTRFVKKWNCLSKKHLAPLSKSPKERSFPRDGLLAAFLGQSITIIRPSHASSCQSPGCTGIKP